MTASLPNTTANCISVYRFLRSEFGLDASACSVWMPLVHVFPAALPPNKLSEVAAALSTFIALPMPTTVFAVVAWTLAVPSPVVSYQSCQFWLSALATLFSCNWIRMMKFVPPPLTALPAVFKSAIQLAIESGSAVEQLSYAMRYLICVILATATD